MGLLDQIERAAGRELPVVYAHELMEMHGVEPKEFWRQLERKGRTVDIRAFVEGAEKPEGPLMVIISEHQGGFLIRLWALWGYVRANAG